MGKEGDKIWCRYNSTGIALRNQFNWQQSSWRQNSKPVWLCNCISIRIFQLMWNICDCFFSLCSLSYYSSSACQEVLQSRVWAISSSFYSGHKSSKASIRPKSINYSTSYPTTNPTRPPWLITKSSRFIRSTSCGYEPKITLTSSS